MTLFHMALLAAVLVAGCGRTQRSETYADGSTYTGDWQNDLPNGRGTATYADGGTYTGEWQDGNFNGQGTRTFPDGTTYTGKWQDGVLVP